MKARQTQKVIRHRSLQRSRRISLPVHAHQLPATLGSHSRPGSQRLHQRCQQSIAQAYRFLKLLDRPLQEAERWTPHESRDKYRPLCHPRSPGYQRRHGEAHSLLDGTHPLFCRLLRGIAPPLLRVELARSPLAPPRKSCSCQRLMRRPRLAQGKREEMASLPGQGQPQVRRHPHPRVIRFSGHQLRCSYHRMPRWRLSPRLRLVCCQPQPETGQERPRLNHGAPHHAPRCSGWAVHPSRPLRRS